MNLTPRSLDPIFRPRSVAVIGASTRADTLGWHVVHKILTVGFTGKVFPVNPKADAVHSIKAYRSILDVPDPVDLAVIIVPKEQVVAVARDCAAKGVRGLVVISAGFKEIGGEGARREAELRDLVRQNGIRMIGPNCMGIINADPAISFDATFAPLPALPGHVGFASQSGAMGVAILNAAAELGIGFTQFVSMGNKADVSGNDLLEYWEDDPETRVIAMYLESFGNPRRFAEIVRRVGRKKPIAIVKSGRTTAGAAAATSHTGALAGADVAVSALLEQTGVLRVDTLDELFHLLMALVRCPIPGRESKGRVAIVTNAGGPGIMATDACVNLGLPLAPLSDETKSRLRGFLPVEASVANPVDMIASADAEQYRRTLEAVVADPAVDAVILISVTPILYNPIDVIAAVTPISKASGKPVLAVMMAKEEFYTDVQSIDSHPPIYRFPESAAKALAQLFRYGAWRSAPAEATPEFSIDRARARSILEGALARGDGYLTPAETFGTLSAWGFPMARWETAVDARSAAEAAARIGYPVVLKAHGEGLLHKSDKGAVVLGIADEPSLTRAVEELAKKLEPHGFQPSSGPGKGDGYLVQEQVPAGREVILGIATDPQIGPLLMVGLGGKYVEVWGDVRFRIPPVRPSEARSMIRELKGFPILAGVRGESPADLDALEEMLLRLSELVLAHPEIIEIDINPVVVGTDRATSRLVDARIRVAPPGTGSPPKVRKEF